MTRIEEEFYRLNEKAKALFGSTVCVCLESGLDPELGEPYFVLVIRFSYFMPASDAMDAFLALAAWKRSRPLLSDFSLAVDPNGPPLVVEPAYAAERAKPGPESP